MAEYGLWFPDSDCTVIIGFIWNTVRILKQLGGEPGDAVRIANAIANGNLESGVLKGDEKKSGLIGDMQRMNENLRRLIFDVANVSDKVATCNRARSPFFSLYSGLAISCLF